MIKIGAFEAKVHFARLLKRVARGEQIVITRYDTPVARLVPYAGTDRAGTQAAIARLKASRKGRRLGSVSWKDLRDEGRR